MSETQKDVFFIWAKYSIDRFSLREMDNFQGREMSYDIDMYLVS